MRRESIFCLNTHQFRTCFISLFAAFLDKLQYILFKMVVDWSILFSLHIRSMWETICDAWACWSGWILVQILQNTPILKYSFRIPPPRKWKLSEILALWLFSFRIPPLPRNWNLGRSWHFDFSVSEYPPPQNPPPAENWNLGRSWHFDFSVLESPPPKIEI